MLDKGHSIAWNSKICYEKTQKDENTRDYLRHRSVVSSRHSTNAILRWVQVRDPAGKTEPQAFFCTDTDMDPAYGKQEGAEVGYKSLLIEPSQPMGNGQVGFSLFMEVRTHVLDAMSPPLKKDPTRALVAKLSTKVVGLTQGWYGKSSELQLMGWSAT